MKIKNKLIKIKDLGLVDYKDCWDYQEELFKGVIDEIFIEDFCIDIVKLFGIFANM